MGSTTQTTKLDPITQEFKKLALEAAKGVSGMEFTPYAGERVAGFDPLQQQAMAGYGALSLPSEYGIAGGVMQELATKTPEQRAAQLGQYTQQYTQSVIDPTIAAMQRERAKAITGEEAALARAGAFGSRGDVYMGERQGEYEARMGQTIGQLQAQGYQGAVARMQAEDAARAAAAGQLASLGGQSLGQQMAILQGQMGAGGMQQALEQQRLDVPYMDYQMAQQFPLTQFSALTTGTGQLPYGSTVTTRDPWGTVGKLMGAGADLATGGATAGWW